MATIRMRYGVVSADDHIQEAPDVWTRRMSRAKFGDDIPHIVELPDGTQTWSLGGSTRGFGGLARVAGVNLEVKRWEEVPASTYTAVERLEILDQEELDASVLFPNIIGITNQNFQKDGSEASRLACIQAYNDWLIDEWQDCSPRFVAQCVAPMWDVGLCVAEIRRAVKRGHRALVWHGAPHVLGLKHFNDPHWYPVYETCCDLDVPICLHSTALPALPSRDSLEKRARAALGVSMTFVSHVEIVSNILCSGVFETFPRLRTISVESGVGWLPYLLEELDHEFEEPPRGRAHRAHAQARRRLPHQHVEHVLARAPRHPQPRRDRRGQDPLLGGLPPRHHRVPQVGVVPHALAAGRDVRAGTQADTDGQRRRAVQSRRRRVRHRPAPLRSRPHPRGAAAVYGSAWLRGDSQSPR